MQRLEQKLDQLKEFPEDTQRFIVDIDSLVRYMDSVIRLEDTKTDHDGLTDQKCQGQIHPNYCLSVSQARHCGACRNKYVIWLGCDPLRLRPNE